ncbi:hypothetical protein BD311DRAFT_748077 [Dichomitus squalens]|uniref:Uncharacterized protein n=1 Tax=Dichomitus squalens TaxID=114155 RepID=A0A4Q9N084_9APHY|nr:hypothetical protein BD311DRAFT_748077 [Dichomitus squalens]
MALNVRPLAATYPAPAIRPQNNARRAMKATSTQSRSERGPTTYAAPSLRPTRQRVLTAASRVIPFGHR